MPALGRRGTPTMGVNSEQGFGHLLAIYQTRRNLLAIREEFGSRGI